MSHVLSLSAHDAKIIIERLAMSINSAPAAVANMHPGATAIVCLALTTHLNDTEGFFTCPLRYLLLMLLSANNNPKM